MKRIKDWIKMMDIQKKLVFCSYIIITPILLLISILLFLYNYRTAVKTEEERCIKNVQNALDSICLVQNNIRKTGVYICINEDIRRVLSSAEPKQLNKDSRLWMNYTPMQMIQDMMAIDGQIKTIAIYPENGVRPYLSCIDRSAYLSDMEQIKKQKIYKLAEKEKGEFFWQRVGRFQSDTYQFNQGDKIVMYRVIYNMSRNRNMAYLVIGATAESIDEICRNSLQEETEAVVVMSGNGTELTRCGNIDDKTVSEIMEEKFPEPAGEEQTGIIRQGKYTIYQCRDDAMGTCVYKIVKSGSWKDLGITIIYAPLALLLGFSIGLYPVLRLVSNIVSKPLHTLGAAMEKFKQGDFTQKVEVTTGDEVGEVSACFNRMVDDMAELIDKNYILVLKERESELDLLQAQINPHFLYNTLDSLYWKAMEAGNEDIAEDIFSLSQIFRLLLNRGSKIVTVRSEAELLERYLHIQKMRFGKRLEYEISLDEVILEETIPKLILQPFVENAIVHGFEKADGNYTLSLIGTKEDSCMVFKIIDTGVGMDEEQLAAIWESAENRKYASQRLGRYAIKNVKERLEIIYGERYELHIKSKTGEGTTVIISLPCE